VLLDAERDSTIYWESDSTSNGSGEHFFAGRTAGVSLRRALIRFDVAGAIPAGSTITGVELTVYMSRSSAGAWPVALHRVLADWGEGASNPAGEEGQGTLAADNDATWAYRFYKPSAPASSPAWTSAGGDFVAGASATQSIGSTGQFYIFGSSAGMVGDAQAWLDTPGSNYGWILIGDESISQTAARFDSRTHPTTGQRPVLAVTYTPPGVTGACCVGDGSCVVVTAGDCAGQSGAYQGDSTTCTPDPCAQPTGACCLSDGSCVVVSDPNCTAQGGTYQGDDAPCDPNLCPVLNGACCIDSGICQELSAADCGTSGGSYQGDGVACEADLCPVTLEPFVDALPIPAVATPTTGVAGGVATYDIEMVEVQQQLHRDLPPTTVWAYDGTYPGPTILASTGNPVTVNWINDLRDPNGNLRTSHYLDVDLCPHGAENVPKTVVHLHGGHLPADVDGYPEDTFLPGFFDTYVFPNNQWASSIWYHDHALGITRLNVYMGLAGFYIITDAVEQALNLPSGEFDIGLAIQDRAFHADGSLKYPSAWQEHFFGDTMVVNGMVWPYQDVKQGKYRYRILNGCNSRTLRLAFDNGMSFELIASEGGLFEQPVTLSEITVGPAERAEIVVDFGPYAGGTEIIMTNSAPAPFPGVAGVGVIPNVMKFVVQGQAGDTDAVPASLRTVERLDPNEAVQFRDFELQRFPEACAGAEWRVNGMHWNDIVEFPEIGTTEVWSFINRSGISHPMHMHLVFFQVLDRQDFTLSGSEIVPVGARIPALAHEVGWKDTVMAPPQQITRVIARFEDYLGKYAYHCHILEHEDHGMMRQFQTVLTGDVNGDCLVNITDLGLVLSNFGDAGPNSPGDVDGDGDTDISDLGILLANFGRSC
jgi:spore coat protein A